MSKSKILHLKLKLLVADIILGIIIIAFVVFVLNDSVIGEDFKTVFVKNVFPILGITRNAEGLYFCQKDQNYRLFLFENNPELKYVVIETVAETEEPISEAVTVENITTEETDELMQEIISDEDNAKNVAKSTGVSVNTDLQSFINEYQDLSYNFAHDNFYVVPGHTALNEDLLNVKNLIAKDFSYRGEYPCVLVYHTHSLESFADSTGEDMTIVQVGDRLCKLLEEQGIYTIHVDTPFDILGGVHDRGRAYDYAKEEITRVIAENPEIDMVIDLHRDGVNENLHFVTDINEKSTAKVMLFNGISYSNANGNIDYLYNPYLENNLALTLQMYLEGKKYYPDFFRCIYIEAYRYNLDLHPGAMLIEAGAQTNTFNEVLNAMEPLSELIYRILFNRR